MTFHSAWVDKGMALMLIQKTDHDSTEKWGYTIVCAPEPYSIFLVRGVRGGPIAGPIG